MGRAHASPDAIIIGGGHNGLTCAFYLARAGLSVRIVEARNVIGGAAVTEEFHPGFRNSVASYTVSLLQPKVIADMGLVGRGYRVIERPVSNFLPLAQGDHLILGGGLERTQAAFARFSHKDAEALPGYYAMLERVADVLRELALRPPPNVGGGVAGLVEALTTGRQLSRLPREVQRDVLDLFTKSAREFLTPWFESAAVQAAFGFDAVVGNYASPDTPGSAYVLLHHVFGEVNGHKVSWGHVIGGMGSITRMMAQACAEQGVEISLNSPVDQVLVEGGRATGVRLASGEELRSQRIIANVGPKLLYGKMVPRAALPQDFARRIDGYVCGSGSFRMNVALDRLPDFTCLPGAENPWGEHLRAGIVIAPSLDYMDRAFADAKVHGWSREPIVEMLIPSLVDDSLAPAGHHVASLFCQQFDPKLDWTPEQEAAAADTIIDTVEAHAPGFRASILGKHVLSPRGLERTFGLIGGDIFHGRMSLDQLWAARPVLGHADYRGPFKGLYMCGSGTHPGGGVTGAPGHNAAKVVLADKRWRRG
ncbi:MAG: phytoene desaturase family protein [Blastomonas fulva]|uniref:phytoene desaturase family protein n=1 Tax=Blastomonas fulva TaxID=1550728 RepID=UPI0040342B84